MSPKLTLYSFAQSSCAWRVRTVLALKNVDYEYVAVNLGKDNEYRKVNPVGQIPALQVDNDIIVDSMAIIDFIDDLYPQIPILPKDPILRAKARAIAVTISSGIQPLQNKVTIGKVLAKAAPGQTGDVEGWCKHWIELRFAALEKLIQETCGKCCVGDEITLADVCLVPQVYNAVERFGVNINNFPNIARINEYLCKQQAFQKSDPSQQPDFNPN